MDDTVKINDIYLEVYFGGGMGVGPGKTFAFLIQGQM